MQSDLHITKDNAQALADRSHAMRSARGKPKNTRTGLRSLKNKIQIQGWRAIDMRTESAKDLFLWRSELLRDLGGEENISAQRLALVDAVVRTRLYISHVDAFLCTQKSLVRRNRSLVPALRERTTLVDSFARLMGMLGLERIAKDAALNLKDYLHAKDAEPTQSPNETIADANNETVAAVSEEA